MVRIYVQVSAAMRRVDIVTWKQEMHCPQTKSTECAQLIISNTDGTLKNRAFPWAWSTVKRKRWRERLSVFMESPCMTIILRKGLRIRNGSDVLFGNENRVKCQSAAINVLLLKLYPVSGQLPCVIGQI